MMETPQSPWETCASAWSASQQKVFSDVQMENDQRHAGFSVPNCPSAQGMKVLEVLAESLHSPDHEMQIFIAFTVTRLPFIFGTEIRSCWTL